MRVRAAAWLVLGLLIAMPAVGVSDSLPWLDDPSPSILDDSGDGRPRLLYFTATWCAPCRLLEREVFDHPDGRAELAFFELIRLDLDSTSGQTLSDRFRVATVPTFVAVDAHGLEIDRVRGYRSRRLLLRDLQSFRTGTGTIGDLERRLAGAPHDPSLQAALGLRRYERLDLDGATVLLTAGLRHAAVLGDTLVADAGRALAELHRRRGEPELAAATLVHLLGVRPDHLYVRASWQLLADCRAEAGNVSGEVEALRGAARVLPLRADSLTDFARAAAELSWELEEAEVAARQAVALTERREPAPQAALAAVLRRQHNYSEAMLWIKRAMATAPEDTLWRVQRDGILEAAISGH